MVQLSRRHGRGDLGQRLATGCDAFVLEDLYDAYGARCYRLAHHVAADPDLAGTVVRDVFLAVWNRTAMFDPACGSVETWLLRRTHRFAVDAVRRRAQPSREGGSLKGAWAAAGADIDNSAGGRRAVVLAALTKLSDAQRHLLQSMYVGGHTQSEIAVSSGNAVSTIRSETVGALRQLHENLASFEPAAAPSLASAP